MKREFHKRKIPPKFQAGIDRIAKKLFSFQMKQPPEKFFKLHIYDQDWFRALAQVGRRIVYKFKSDYKFNDTIYPKELFGYDKEREKKANHSGRIVYTKIKAKGKYDRVHESRKNETNAGKLQR